MSKVKTETTVSTDSLMKQIFDAVEEYQELLSKAASGPSKVFEKDAPDGSDLNARDYNVGKSDYASFRTQPWDLWKEYNLNPWDADIVKRVLRTKEDSPRVEDYKKIMHVCQERIAQLTTEAKNRAVQNCKTTTELFKLLVTDQKDLSGIGLEKTKTHYKKRQDGWNGLFNDLVDAKEEFAKGLKDKRYPVDFTGYNFLTGEPLVKK